MGRTATASEGFSKAILMDSLGQYPTRGHTAFINFVTCYDGFSLTDLISYNDKHNRPQSGGYRDGADDNRSWNCSAEGSTDDSQLLALRRR